MIKNRYVNFLNSLHLLQFIILIQPINAKDLNENYL